MIRFLSDPHAQLDYIELDSYLENANDDDLLILLGDVGIKFEETEENKIFTEKLLNCNKKIAFLDGNHENFGFINSFPTEVWNGGKIHRLSDNVIHLMRGEVYEIEGKTFFVFGGCKSSAKWKEMGLWFDGEEGTTEEFQNAYDNLKKYNNKIDYVLTHKRERREYKEGVSQPLYDLCMYIEDKVDYKTWYCGHWHIDRQMDEKCLAIYKNLTALE